MLGLFQSLSLSLYVSLPLSNIYVILVRRSCLKSSHFLLFKNITHDGSFLLQSYKWDGWMGSLWAPPL